MPGAAGRRKQQKRGPDCCQRGRAMLVREGDKPGSVSARASALGSSSGQSRSSIWDECHHSPRCDHPGSHWAGRPPPLSGLAPDGVYQRWLFPIQPGALLPHRFTLTAPIVWFRWAGAAVWFLWHFPSASRRPAGRTCPAAFARRPAVSWHPALWCPDFPHIPLPEGIGLRDRVPSRTREYSRGAWHIACGL